MKRKKKTTFTAENTDDYWKQVNFSQPKRSVCSSCSTEELLQLFRRDAPQGRLQEKLQTHLVNSIQNNQHTSGNPFGLNPIYKGYAGPAVIVAEEIGMRRASILGLMLHDSVRCGTCTAEEVERNYGEDVAGIIRGLIRVNELYAESPAIEIGELPQPAAVLWRGHARYPRA